MDSACPKPVSGEVWVTGYLETLNNEELADVSTIASNESFKFGDGPPKQSKYKICLPIYVGASKRLLWLDVVEADIPLLLGQQTMGLFNMTINFGEKTLYVDNVRNDELFFSSSGHYCLPMKQNNAVMVTSSLPLSGCVLRNQSDTDDSADSIWLTNDLLVQDMSAAERKKVAWKLHRQFNHCSYDKIAQLLKDAGVTDKNLMDELKGIRHSCDTCLKYKRSSPRPAVGFPMAKNLNETLAMDLKEITGQGKKLWFLHIIDLATRYSGACIVESKNKEVIVSAIFKCWISVFGSPLKILVDNGGEFANDVFMDYCENFNVRIKTTAGESPWSNGTVERHNGLIGQSLDKICEETDCELDVALAWAVSAKNSLTNVHGYSPNQLVFGRNPNYPCVLENYPPALEGKSISKTVADNLNAMHVARQEFIKSESSDRLRRALKHQVRPSSNVQFFIGDDVYYKRLKSKYWQGPATVIGQDGQQILVKHGSYMYRVHPCKVKLRKEASTTKSDCIALPNSNVVPHHAGRDNEIVTLQDSDSDEHLTPTSGNNSDSAEADNNVSSSRASEQSNIESVSNTLKKNLKISYALAAEPNQWRNGNIVRRTGKAKGKYKHCWAVENEDGVVVDLDFENDVVEWRVTDENEHAVVEVAQEEVLFIDQSKRDAVQDAKDKELKSWQNNNVHTEVEYCGQFCISTRWVLTEKVTDGEIRLKARLVARGYEEDSKHLLKDSPTCSKQSFRLMLVIISSNNWICHSIDVKTAFLQGKPINRDVYLMPPKEFKREGFIWKLNKCVYGLNDASRTWYLRVREELERLGVKVSSYDAGLFYWVRNSHLEGILRTHVDDFCWGGSSIFQENIIAVLYDVFLIGSEASSSFKYLGLNVNQVESKICVDQQEYVANLAPLDIPASRKKSDKLSSNEQTLLRKFTGQMNWLATQTRPDVLFDCCYLMGCITKATVDDIYRANKCLRRLKTDHVKLCFKRLPSLCDVHLKVFSDASFGNMFNGGSQGGYVVFLCNETDAVPLR